MTERILTPSQPSAIYVWLVPSEHVLEQPGSWRIRKWDTAPFPEANYTLAAPSEIKDTAPIGTPRDGVTARRDAPLWKPTSAKYEHPLAWESNVTGKVYVACVGRDGNTYQVELEKP